tara:strand:- start:435 stop:767 length:333 start_codon:yes stop_codon:yes gene_type:complete
MGAVENSLIPKGKKYNNLSHEDKLAIAKEIQGINDQTKVNAIINKFIEDKVLREEKEAMQKHIDDNSKNRGGMTMRKGNMAYNKGGMGKSKTGHSDYRKGGMVYTTKGKK